MIIPKNIIEYDSIKIFPFYSFIQEDSMYGKAIANFLHDPEDIYYFVYFRDLKTSIDRCRISMTEPKYLESDFILTIEERNLLIKILTEYNVWNKLIDAEKEDRKELGFNSINCNLLMPNYNLLEVI